MMNSTVESSPRVSVIIPTYNRIHFLREALESLCNQTYSNYEVLVIQNGPFHDAQSIVEEFKNRIAEVKYIHLDLASAANARNIGILQSRGEYIAILEDDDRWFAEKLEKQVKLLDRETDAALVSARAIQIYENGKLGSLRPEHFKPCDYGMFMQHEAVGLIASLSGVMFRKIAAMDTGLFNLKYTISNDVDFYLRLCKKYKITTMEEPLLYYRVHSGNASSDLVTGWRDVVHILEQEVKIMPKEFRSEIHRAIQSYLSKIYAFAADYFTDAEYQKAISGYWFVISHNPWFGMQIRWGQEKSSIYKLLRPYLAAFYCLFKLISRHETKTA